MRDLYSAAGRGAAYGLLITIVLAVIAVWTNVIAPGGPDESDSDPEYRVWYLITLIALAAAFAAVGWLVRGDQKFRTGGMAGASAGAVVAIGVTVTFLAINNAFLDLVMQQHDKRVAFASSGWTSARAYLATVQIEGGAVLLPVLALFGGGLGLLGGLVRGHQTIRNQ
ncbi:hypothetical protein [Smaragdicoccus niigatensis]|uniref:hypothetical protein n=1 Tax=Smaragdicoccus niigatensis TaxID=359359 RepID=UPI0012DC9DA1|nr:hypothetical protein [Smaragdicoccus niigatensis]